MKLKLKRNKQNLEKRLLTAMVLSTEFLKGYCYLHRKDVFTTPYGSWVAETCVDFYKKYQAAPNKEMLVLYKSAARAGRINPTVLDVTRDFVKSLDYEVTPTINTGYMLTRTKDYIVLQLHKLLLKRLQVAIEKEDSKLCEEAVTQVRQIRVQSGQVCDPLNDKQKLMDAFLKDERQLFKLKGALGRMMNPQFKPKRMIGILARAKAGKTAWQYRLGLLAKRQSNHVAIFAAGDEDEDASIIRMACSITGKNNDDEYVGDYALPVIDCGKNQRNECQKKGRRCRRGLPELSKEDLERLTPEELLASAPKYTACSYCREREPRSFEPAVWYKEKTVGKLIWQEAWRAFQRFHRWSPKSSLRLFTYSAKTLTVSEIIRQLDMAEDIDGWVPTVVIVDYPDIMDDESKSSEVRHKENEKWLALRKLSQDRSICLIVATQSNRLGFGQDSLDTENANEDRRKIDHCTAFYALNQTDGEKRKRLMRVGPIAIRKGKFDVEYQVQVLQAMEAGQPFRDSFVVYRPKKKLVANKP